MINAHTLHRRAVRVLPQVLQTSGVLPEETRQEQIAALLFPLRRRSSGAVMFRLSRQTAEAMGEQPLAYLRDATQARQGLGRLRLPFVYRPWKSACIPASVFAGPRRRAETGALQVFYTRKVDGKAWMVVVPEERWVVYAWRD